VRGEAFEKVWGFGGRAKENARPAAAAARVVDFG
jgi:hypothetical protein